MLPLRLAGNALKVLYPELAAGERVFSRKFLTNTLANEGPNLLFAGMTGLSLPGQDGATGYEGASFGERAGAAAFDAATSIPVGMAGRLLGAGLGGVIGRARKRPLSPDWQARIQGVAGMGAETALWGSGVIQNPFTNSAIERYNQAAMAAQENDKRAYREQILAEAEQERQRRTQALAGYGGAGAALSSYGFEGFPGLGGLG